MRSTDVPTPGTVYIIQLRTLLIVKVNYKCTFVFLCSRYVKREDKFTLRHGERAAAASTARGNVGTLFLDISRVTIYQVSTRLEYPVTLALILEKKKKKIYSTEITAERQRAGRKATSIFFHVRKFPLGLFA